MPKDLSLWEKMGKAKEASGTLPVMSPEVLTVLHQVEEALRNSEPKFPHYPEPHVRHKQALDAVQKLLKGHPVIPS